MRIMMNPYVWALVAALALANVVQWYRNGAMEAQVELAQGNLTTCTANTSNAITSATAWEGVAKDVKTKLVACQTMYATLEEQNRRALREALARAVESERAFDVWLDRYDSAARESSCAALLSTPLCEEVYDVR